MRLTSHMQSACTNGVTWHGPKGWAGRSHLRPRDGVGRSGQKTPATPFWDWCCPHRSRFPEGQDCCRLSSRNQLELLGTNVNTKCFKMLSVPPPARFPPPRAPQALAPCAPECLAHGSEVLWNARDDAEPGSWELLGVPQSFQAAVSCGGAVQGLAPRPLCSTSCPS